ncbi:MAG: hypothetical protein NUV59_03235 [Patescibacteria group bacterium]|nr:hypothetical protein [Patescibacteria group bacterium]
MDSLEERVQKIEERNITVEQDKAWETSWTRKFLIVVFTYIAIGVFLAFIHVERPWLSAIVPALAFTLSTLTMPYFKRAWVQRNARKRKVENE